LLGFELVLAGLVEQIIDLAAVDGPLRRQARTAQVAPHNYASLFEDADRLAGIPGRLRDDGAAKVFAMAIDVWMIGDRVADELILRILGVEDIVS
jgi:hypothetical protein